jgi:arylsulfatase A
MTCKQSMIILAAGMVLLFWGCREEQALRPNIILILADDLGYGDPGCYGQQLFKTPNIDRLAAQGMLFTQHYAGSTVCAPSRSCLMTGQHTGHTPVRGNMEMQPEGQYPLEAEAVTIAELLKQSGYACGAFGKWGLGPVGSEGRVLRV